MFVFLLLIAIGGILLYVFAKQQLEGVKRNIRNTNFIVNGKNDEEVGRRERMAIRRLMPAKEDQEEEELRERGGLLQSTSTTPTHNSNSRRRKGIPHRAPLGS